MPLDRGRRRVDVQFAELAAEIEVLLRREMLVAEEDHQVFGQRAMDLVHLPVADGVRRSTSPISAPMIGVNLSTVIDRRAIRPG